MLIDAMPPQRIDHLIWAIIAATVAALLALALFFGFHFEGSSFIKAILAGTVLAAGGLFYRHVRYNEQMAAALTGTAQLMIFSCAAAPLSYVAASTGLPLWDSTFSHWDRLLGLDWTVLLRLMNDNPTLHWLFWLSYLSFPFQAPVMVLGLAFTGRIMHLRIFMLSFVVATLVTIAGSALMPAEGVWGHLNLTAGDYSAIIPATRDIHLPIFHGLRDGSLRTLTAEGAEGIITFPSLHSAVALLFMLALWPVKYLRWPVILLNVMMIASTPIDGGHYFSDIIAGLIIAALSWKASAIVVARLSRHPSAIAGGIRHHPAQGVAAS